MNRENQMELTFHGALAPTLKQRRQKRAQWWFTQMRTVVDRAFDWQSDPPARPDQVFLQLGQARRG